MKPRLRKFAPIGLYLSLAAIIVTAGLYIVYRTFNLGIQISLAVAILSLAAWILLDPAHVQQIFRGRQARYGSNAVIMTIAFIGIVVVINVVGIKYAPRWDLTEGQRNTLAPETLEILAKLPEKVSAQAFFTAAYPSDTARTMLENYQRGAKGNFEFEFIDPNSNPIAAQNARIQRDGTVVLTMGDMQEQVTYVTELELDKALLRMINPTQRAVYFLAGHGEFDIETATDYGYSRVKSTLLDKNYAVKTLNLLSTPAIPEDAKVIVVASPLKPLSENEVGLLKAYLDAGGSLLVFNEPSIVSNFESEADPLAQYIDTNWGITFGDDLVLFLDKEPSVLAIAGAYDTSHPITAKMNQIATVFPRARSISISNLLPELNQIPLVYTSDQYWGETDLANIETGVSFDRATDLVGPITLVVAAENRATGARLLVIGDGEFATNAFVDYYGNLDFMANSVDWATEQEDYINLTPKNTTERVLVPPQTLTMGIVLLVSIFVIPGLVIVAGIVALIQRRRRG